MALQRLASDEVYRLYLASPLAFANIATPTDAELNANPTNDPDGLIWNLTCALDTGSSQFDLDDPELDDSLTFCQKSGDGEVLSRSATIVYAFNQAKARWLDASSTASIDGFNTATLAQSLLTWRGVTYLAIMSVGKASDEVFVAGDQVKIAEVSTDHATWDIATGSNVIGVQTFAKRTDLAWNVDVVAA